MSLSEEVWALVKCVRCASCYEDGAKAQGCPVPHANETCDTLPDRIAALEAVEKAVRPAIHCKTIPQGGCSDCANQPICSALARFDALRGEA